MLMVLNSAGIPPAISTPSFAFAARRWRWQWPGCTSFQVLTIATSGRSICSRVWPTL